MKMIITREVLTQARAIIPLHPVAAEVPDWSSPIAASIFWVG